MLNPLQSFSYDDKPVRVVWIAGEPWFVANDLCDLLGIRNARHAIDRLDEDQKGVVSNDTLGGTQAMNAVNESGMWDLLLDSRKPDAKRIRKWLVGEVLPSLRRTGRYEMPGHPGPATDAIIASDIDTPRLSASVAAVRVAKQLWGLPAARQMWIQLGLPEPLVEAIEYQGDPLAASMQEWLVGKHETSSAEIAVGLGMGEPDFALRRRITANLRLIGWGRKKVRRGLESIWVWQRLSADA